jgi:hypothetical protein
MISSSSYSKTPYKIQSLPEGKIRLVPPCDKVFSSLSERPQIEVEGPGWDFAPDMPMSLEEIKRKIQKWRSTGYRIRLK